MHRIQVPFVELLGRLITLNQDRHTQYAEFARFCNRREIQYKCYELAEQSQKNLDELFGLLNAFDNAITPGAPFSVSPALWKLLYDAEKKYENYYLATIIYKIEEQFSILYKLICGMFSFRDPAPENVIRDQYQRLLKSKAQIPHLLMYFN